jgi:hypothetical protein
MYRIDKGSYKHMSLCNTSETVFKENMPELTITHFIPVNSVVIFPPLLQRERGGVGKISPIGYAQFASVC